MTNSRLKASERNCGRIVTGSCSNYYWIKFTNSWATWRANFFFSLDSAWIFFGFISTFGSAQTFYGSAFAASAPAWASFNTTIQLHAPRPAMRDSTYTRQQMTIVIMCSLRCYTAVFSASWLQSTGRQVRVTWHRTWTGHNDVQFRTLLKLFHPVRFCTCALPTLATKMLII